MSGLGLDRELLGLGEVGPVWVEVQEAGGDGLGLERPVGLCSLSHSKENKNKTEIRKKRKRG